ncbi:unnamed protein product [Acanthoscelides obtectus]|uniref:Uncharacterized protein n=1 Tax=Acanthoscelides obtectus TaxID=200917 RepID=A0A9P0PG15_ACAOB|nr:unnamed protein product [Acanthoscelides obtectus]CAK1675541.1 hypothetical protein AOBTE_LOCUS30287 [Acanthoscelides obtectus]
MILRVCVYGRFRNTCFSFAKRKVCPFPLCIY